RIGRAERACDDLPAAYNRGVPTPPLRMTELTMKPLPRFKEAAARAFPCRPGRRCLVLLLAGCCAWGDGCGVSGRRMGPVAGKVRVDGKPLTTGSVSFRPDKAKGNTSTYEPAGDIDADGNYKLYTPVRADAPKEGAPPGWYRVAVISAE